MGANQNQGQRVMFNAFEMAAAEKDFQTAYGRFMQGWARLEQAMFYLFKWLSLMPETRARSIFYSAKNFQGRADMLKAALDNAEVEASYVEFVKQAIKKASQFNSFRNTVTHGEAVHDARDQSATFKQYILVEGRYEPRSETKGVSVVQLAIAFENVRGLSKLMFDVLQRAGQTSYPPAMIESLDKCLEQVRALPNVADHAPQGSSV